MKKQSIKSHLTSYSIIRKRKTTINHAFASAIAPVDKYDEVALDAALRILGQNPDDLRCVYCGSHADTWDHLIGLVKDEKLRGFGRQLGNLVPCCRACNSKKGSKDWEVYLREMPLQNNSFEEKSRLIASYLSKATEVNLKRPEEMFPVEWKRYAEIKEEIFNLMREADEIAEKLNKVVASRQF